MTARHLAEDCRLARDRSRSAVARRTPSDSDPTRNPNPPTRPLEPSSGSGPSCLSTIAQPITRPRCTLPTKSNFLHGTFRHLLAFDSSQVEKLFRAEVLRLLVARAKISEEVVENLLSWSHPQYD